MKAAGMQAAGLKSAGVRSALAFACGLVLAVPQAGAAQQPVPRQQPAVEVTDALIDRFVAVYPAVMQVAQETQAKLATAETAEAAESIQAQSRQRLMTLLEEAGMTVPQYEAVVVELNNDPELRAAVLRRVLDASGRAGDESRPSGG